MARTQKKGLDYFPFDVDFFSDKKIKILKARYGSDGITVFQYLLCEIYRNGYFIKLDDDYEYIISYDLKMSSEKIGQIINFLLERSLFDNKLFKSDKVLTSRGIQSRFQEAVKSRGAKTQIEICGDFWILSESETKDYISLTQKNNSSEKNNDNSEKNNDNSENYDTNKIKENKSKLNQSKEKNLNPTNSDFVSLLASEYFGNGGVSATKRLQGYINEWGEGFVIQVLKDLKSYDPDDLGFSTFDARLNTLKQNGIKTLDEYVEFLMMEGT